MSRRKAFTAFAFACALSIPTGAQRANPPGSDAERLAQLQLSKVCAEEGGKYAARSAPKDNTEFFESSTHYSRALNRCLVQITHGKGSGKTSTFSVGIYDPIEDVSLASYATLGDDKDTTLLECDTTDWSGNRVECVADKHQTETALSIFRAYRNRVMTN